MAYSKLVRSAELPYHVVNRCLDKEFYPVSLDKCWEQLMFLCHTITCIYGARIHAFVLMSNHYHMLVSTPDANLDDCMQYFQREFSLWMKERTAKQRYRFQGRYRSCLIYEERHFLNVYRYIYQNPMRAGVVKKAEDYPFSSLHGRVGKSVLKFPIWPSAHLLGGALPESLEDEVEFINNRVAGDEVERTRRALGRRNFRPAARLAPSTKKI